jgi:hypothetical protein
MLSELRQKFPALFAECRWIQCAVGWRGLIERASVELEALSHREDVPIEVLEIREKYGLLQIWVVAATPRVDAAAEAIVGKTETESDQPASSVATPEQCEKKMGGSKCAAWRASTVAKLDVVDYATA